MKTIKIIRLNDEEKKEIELSYNQVENPKIELDEIIAKNDNQTYIVLKIIGNNRDKWKNILDMTLYNDVVNKIGKCDDDFINLSINEITIIKKVMKEEVENKKTGINIDKLSSVYMSFVNENKYKND